MMRQSLHDVALRLFHHRLKRYLSIYLRYHQTPRTKKLAVALSPLQACANLYWSATVPSSLLPLVPLHQLFPRDSLLESLPRPSHK